MASALIRTAQGHSVPGFGGQSGRGICGERAPSHGGFTESLAPEDCAARMLALQTQLRLGHLPAGCAALGWLDSCARYSPAQLRDAMKRTNSSAFAPGPSLTRR